MKKLILLFGFMGILVLNIAWMLQGCNGRLPVNMGAFVATSTPTLQPQWVANFEGGTAAINGNLYNSNNGNFNFLPTTGNFVVPGGANGTNYACNVLVGTQLLTNYAPYELEANPNSTGLFTLAGAPVRQGGGLDEVHAAVLPFRFRNAGMHASAPST